MPVILERTFDLRSLRVHRLGWAQDRMAHFLGCSQPALSRMETRGRVGLTYLKLLATIAPPFIVTRTEDGSIIVFDPDTGLSASGATEDEAMAELRRLLTTREAA